jgi:uncharacterized protein
MSSAPLAVWSGFLASKEAPGSALSVLALDGYLTCVLVTPQAAPILPGTWIAGLWGDEAPVFADDTQINTVLDAVTSLYNTVSHNIEQSVKRFEVEGIADYRPLFLSGDGKPAHDAVREWVSGFRKGMKLAPATWSALMADERTKVVMYPFVGFFDGDLGARGLPADIDRLLDEDAALIPRAILLLRMLARIRETAGAPPPSARGSKIGRNESCPCGSGKKFKRCCGAA